MYLSHRLEPDSESESELPGRKYVAVSILESDSDSDVAVPTSNLDSESDSDVIITFVEPPLVKR